MSEVVSTGYAGHTGSAGHAAPAGELSRAPVAQASLRPPTAGAAGRFALHFLEMVVVMFAGMAVYHPLVRALPPAYAGWFARGTYLGSVGMALSMALPMAPWMRLRGHGWRPGAEMALAMFAPTAVVVLLCWLGLDQGQPWIRSADGPGMLLAMVGVMLYRREHYTGGRTHRAHRAYHAALGTL